ncbi:LOW QUALITY PROTEIN: hypothetical protein PHMEG_00021475 [Phytophthora megakarya]|uniref:Tyr recombinase domain-containing protein n=1 Tax=Phytophthora megakarya TaxID=4795 RepID=A0A225VP23_9STRA|nr:LOW QUALITY PROTEIN: hypothetical protein PHMEG_00021475 [Phytophthora megakarya]
MVNLSLSTASYIQLALEEELLRQEVRLSLNHTQSGFVRGKCTNKFEIDKTACSTLSHIIRSKRMSLDKTTRFLRGENAADSRPNKAIDPDRLRLVLHGYPHLDLLVEIAEHGIDALWRSGPAPRRPPPKNHGSCRRYLQAVTRSIREGQSSGQYLVVDADILNLWPEVVCSPLGAVEKKGVNPAEEVRTIHDLSFPKRSSVNDVFIAASVPKVRYESVKIIAVRIEYLATNGHAGRIRMLKGDVKGAFRHLRIRANQVFRMAAYIAELGILVVDLAAPFGWSGSPPYYALFGRAISWLMGSNSPASVSSSADENAFFPYEWVDDHILVEPDVEDRLHLAEATLRHAMLAVLGPRAINEAKFSTWSSKLVALGLLWNTTRRTVSIPSDKVTKAKERVTAMLNRGKATKTEFYKVLGSLRHVATCLHTARPFYQRLQDQCTSTTRFGDIRLSAGSRADLLWFQQILTHGHLAELPLSLFGNKVKPHVELYMDASNTGLAVLDPAPKEFIQIAFDDDELKMISQVSQNDTDFSINVREHLCIALALWSWGSKWYHQAAGSLVHIQCWSDNISAVQWCNKLQSQNPVSQELNRCIGLAEVYYNLRVSANHIPGSSNWMADAASRACSEPYREQWTNFSSSWSQTQVPLSCRKLYKNFSNHFKPNHWPRHQERNIAALGHSGANGANGCIFRRGCPKSPENTRTSSVSSPPTAGDMDGVVQALETLPAPCSPKSAMYRGIIGECWDTELPCSPAISSRSPECEGMTFPPTQNRLLPQTFSKHCTDSSISAQPSTGFFGGLRCWVSSFFSEEYLAIDGKVQPYALHRSDISFVSKNDKKAIRLADVCAVEVLFRGSKSDQFGVGATRRLERSGARWCCPVLAAWYLVEHHKSLAIAENSLLCKIDASTNLQVRHLVSAIKMAAKAAGQDPERYSSHSLRSGGASALFNAGFDSLAVKLFGRWRSDAVERYTRIDGRLTAQMAREMLAKPASQRHLGAPSKPHPGNGGAFNASFSGAVHGTPPRSFIE